MAMLCGRNMKEQRITYFRQRNSGGGLCFLYVLENSVFRHEVDENSPLLGYYAASICNFLSTFRKELQVRNCHYTMRCNPDEGSLHIVFLVYFFTLKFSEPIKINL